MVIEILKQVRELARKVYAWPGGYPQYMLMADGEVLCAKCARSEYRSFSRSTHHKDDKSWQAVAVCIHFEGEPLICAHCNAEIKSAYGVPEND